MRVPVHGRGDSTLPLLLHGYAWLPNRLRETAGAPVRTHLLGHPAIALHGPQAVQFFYDEENVRRSGAVPDPVLDTLFGRGAVHTLDGAAHRVRKALFLALLKDPAGVEALTEAVVAQWREAVAGDGGGAVVLFDTAAEALAGAVCAWVGLAPTAEQARLIAHDCVAMVDGFATPGLRHLRARHSRTRQEAALAALVTAVRDGRQQVRPGSALEAVAGHRDVDGLPADERTCAVELLNIIRPTVAITWFITFAAHALHRHPDLAEELRAASGRQLRDLSTAFAHEVRRFYPFVPFVGGVAARDLTWQGVRIDQGTMVLLDVYGHHHDAGLWHNPYHFTPARFTADPDAVDRLVAQGGGDPALGHRCPGEDITVSVLAAFVGELAHLDPEVPDQDLTIPLSRIPTRPHSGFVLRLPTAAADASAAPAARPGR
ncbi:cytochrome P450 [Streptomyces sp. NPDC047718]|uniref:cytochrome P450 n=1 Tax=Streptomyces sp. NPDC047718 TaxID=3155479 RepID=UPI0033CBDC10